MQVKLPEGEKTLLEMTNSAQKHFRKGSHGGGSQVESSTLGSSGNKTGFAFPLSTLLTPRGKKGSGGWDEKQTPALSQNGPQSPEAPTATKVNHDAVLSRAQPMF